eukprot:6208873-Pleurochrysis_carterae.AAC.14
MAAASAACKWNAPMWSVRCGLCNLHCAERSTQKQHQHCSSIQMPVCSNQYVVSANGNASSTSAHVITVTHYVIRARSYTKVLEQVSTGREFDVRSTYGLDTRIRLSPLFQRLNHSPCERVKALTPSSRD